MSIIDQLSAALTPHREAMQEHLAFQGVALHNRLHAIEQAVNDLGRGDIGNKWQRIVTNKTLTSGEDVELGICPINEIWLIQAIASDGVQEKSPPFVVLANKVLIASIIKEGIGFEGIGGNQILLPGERLSVVARETGAVNFTITFIRRPYPGVKIPTDMGRSAERFSPRSTHDTGRDEIASRTDRYSEQAPELAATEGRRG
jgi:hypothetical protein